MGKFSQSVRKELCASVADKDKAFACLYAMFIFSRRGDELRFTVNSVQAAELFASLTDTVFRGKVTPLLTDEKSFEITDAKQTGLVRDKFPFLKENAEFSFSRIGRIRQDAFFAGIFLACAGISDPQKEYHLEFFTPTAALCAELYAELNSRGIVAKARESGSVYIKDSESIEDTLALMGAGMSALNVMNAKIHKDIANRANRAANCDTANIDRTLAAARRQLEAIERLRQAGAFESLSAPLRELAELRINNPESSLTELGELLSPPIGRAGVNRRMQKLEKAAAEL